MKPIINFFLSIFLITNLFAQHNDPKLTVYQKLSNVNKEWLKQDIHKQWLTQKMTFKSDEDLIKYHLQRVEAILRAKDVKGLTKSNEPPM